MAQSFKNTYAPELEDIKTIAKSVEAFRGTHLSDSTNVTRIVAQPKAPIQASIITGSTDIEAIPAAPATSCSQLFFIYKYLIQNQSDPVPNDANKLQISAAALEGLAKRLMLPAAFIFALTRHYLPNGRGSRILHLGGSRCFDFWYFLPVRVQVEASSSHAIVDNNDSSQMNPFHKLHLPDVHLDIHRSCVGIFSRVDPSIGSFTFVAFDFMHGRWPKVALEPKERISGVLKRHSQLEVRPGREYCVHLVYLTSAARWWTNSLNSINEQLIAYERRLQVELDKDETTPEQVLTELNRALHSIAAHLQRYLSELKSLQGIVTELSADYSSVHKQEISSEASDHHEHASRGYAQVLSQVDAAHEFAVELERKAQNILALLFNRIKISSDRLLVANGRAMQAILSAMQEDASLAQKMASESHKLAQEMKKDSIAMKTIAIVTMFFLPGATFATLLSMPFFDDNEWMGNVSRFWLWVVLSVPSTLACFAFYRMSRKRAQRRAYESDSGIALETQIPAAQNVHAA